MEISGDVTNAGRTTTRSREDSATQPMHCNGLLEAESRNICVPASYFSQVDARPRHFLIETDDETAADGEGASLNQNGSKREVALSLNRQSKQSQGQKCVMCQLVRKDTGTLSVCDKICDKV